MNKAALLIALIMLLIGLLSPYIAPYDPEDFSFDSLMPPDEEHILGTNSLGQDLFSQLLYGFRFSTIIALVSAFISTFIGTVLAMLCSYYGGWVEAFIMKLTDFFLIIPEIIVIMLFSVFAGPGLYNIIAAIALFSWSKVTRILRTKSNLAIKDEGAQYTLLLKGNLADVMRKIWPQIYPAAATMFVLQCSKAILYEANLSFLGIGDPTVKSWGRLIRQAMDYEGLFFEGAYLWWLLPPIACIVIFVGAMSLISFDMNKETIR